MIDVTIITPFYKGNIYIKNYIENLDKIYKETDKKYKIEVLFVNDSPEIDIEINEDIKQKYNIRIIKNSKNMGVHLSRINGYNNALGKYIIFLDQDDELKKESINVFLNKIGDNDMCISNGIYELNNKEKVIYKKYLSKYTLKEEKYLKIKNFIISPGQCLIKKESISKRWLESPLKINGADDYMLWLLMFEEGKKINYINDILYVHKDTGSNLSFNVNNMLNSLNCMLDTLKNIGYNTKKINQIKDTINVRTNLRRKNIFIIFKHPYLTIYNIIYEILDRI